MTRGTVDGSARRLFSAKRAAGGATALVLLGAVLAIPVLPTPAAAQQTPPAAAPAQPAETAPATEAPSPAPAAEPASEPAEAKAAAGAEPAKGDEIVLELNNLQPIQPNGCRFTFLATNNRASPIERLGVELVVFDAEKKVDQFLVLEFTRLAGNKTKVSQFDLADRSCEAVSRLLVNDVVNCGIEPGAVPTCAERVRLRNITDIELAF